MWVHSWEREEMKVERGKIGGMTKAWMQVKIWIRKVDWPDRVR